MATTLLKPNVKRLEAKRDVEALVRAIDHKDPQVRKDAALALMHLADPRSIDALIAVVDDKEIGWIAAEALGDIGDPRAVEPLLGALNGPGYSTNAAARALGRIGDERAIEPLKEKLALVQEQAADGAHLPEMEAIEWVGRRKETAEFVIRALGALGVSAPAASDRGTDPSRCAACKRPFPQASEGFEQVADRSLSWRQGCDACGVPVCFNCSAEEAEKQGLRGSCVCPSCGETLD